MLKFRSISEKSVLKNPLNNFAEETQTIELRQDPLLGTWSRINIDRAKRVHQSHTNDDNSVKELIKKSRESCFFCAENIDKKTPELPANLNLGERLKCGTFTLIPNLYPFAKYHAVGILTQKHDATPAQITSNEWENAIAGSIKYLKAVIKSDKASKYASINMNYMPPAAASIFHPHLQIICDTKSTVYQEMLYKKSVEFYRKNKKNYFEMLASEDKERRIAYSGNIAWLATYSPVAANDITGIFRGKSSLFDLIAPDIKAFAEELANIFGAYWRIGARSTNMSIFSSPLDEKNKSFSLHARIISRPALQQFYGADRGFLEVLHREPVVSTVPEELSIRMRNAMK